ncbi:MAG: glycosyltransferase [Bacteroidota bacterium]|nr:glycosyltransferase [Bacteroidota bacterium]
MKVLQFIYELVPGGAERFVVDLSNELSLTCNTVIYTLRDDSVGNRSFYVPEINDRVKYVNLKIEPGFSPMLIWTFYRILKKEEPDIVHCHLNLVNYFFPLAFLLRKRIRFFYTIHNAAETEVESGTERILRRFSFKHRFFNPVAISDETKASYQSYYKLNDVPVIYNGRTFCGKSADYVKVAEEVSGFKATENTLVFCHVSRYDENQKNHTMLVSVFNKLKDENQDVVLLIIGEGFEKAFRLKAMSKDNIHFLGVKTNVVDYLYASDAFCLSSRFEGMPISLIEAFACGCPSICTPVGGIVNTIEHGVTGYLSKTISEEDYLEAVKQFIRSGKELDREKMKRFYSDNFSIQHCTARYLGLYQKN